MVDPIELKISGGAILLFAAIINPLGGLRILGFLEVS